MKRQLAAFAAAALFLGLAQNAGVRVSAEDAAFAVPVPTRRQ